MQVESFHSAATQVPVCEIEWFIVKASIIVRGVAEIATDAVPSMLEKIGDHLLNVCIHSFLQRNINTTDVCILQSGNLCTLVYFIGSSM